MTKFELVINLKTARAIGLEIPATVLARADDSTLCGRAGSVCGSRAFVEGFEGGTVTACAEGGHVEDVTDRHPTTIDAAVSLDRGYTARIAVSSTIRRT